MPKRFKNLFKNKDAIEEAFGNPLNWMELPENKMSAVTFKLEDVNLYDESNWEKMNQFFIKYLPKFENAFKPFIKDLK